MTPRTLAGAKNGRYVLVDYDKLTQSSWLNQIRRIEDSRAAISARDQVAAAGRVLPGTQDLVYGTGRRLRAAVLFLDICRFSSRLAETQREQDMLLRVLTFFFTEMVRIAEDHGGMVEKNTGDGLMVHFEDGGGTPPAPGSKRAMACALTMFYTIQTAINPVIIQSGLEPLTVRMGIEVGWITVAKLGAARRFGSLAAVGTTANMANKMLAVAGPGDLVIGEAVKRELPFFLQLQFCERIFTPSGWVYRESGQPYPFYKYTGRWRQPL